MKEKWAKKDLTGELIMYGSDVSAYSALSSILNGLKKTIDALRGDFSVLEAEFDNSDSKYYEFETLLIEVMDEINNDIAESLRRRDETEKQLVKEE